MIVFKGLPFGEKIKKLKIKIWWKTADTSFHNSNQRPSTSSSSKSSSISYISFSERRKNTELVKLIAKQAEDSTQREIKLSEQTFELEKEKPRGEALIAKKHETAAELENYANYNHKTK